MSSTRRLADAAETFRVQMMATAIGTHVFAGQHPAIIGAVLADLMSTFLLNHRIPDDLKREAELREEILTQWCETVRALVAIPQASETLQ